MQIEQDLSRYQLVPLSFMQEAVAANQSDVQLGLAELADPVSGKATTGVQGYIMPWSGWIVGISYKLSAAATAGQLTIGPTIAGTEQTALTVTVTTATSGSKVVSRDAIYFAAGSEIGAEITTNSSWNGTTADLGVVVWVIVKVENI